MKNRYIILWMFIFSPGMTCAMERDIPEGKQEIIAPNIEEIKQRLARIDKLIYAIKHAASFDEACNIIIEHITTSEQSHASRIMLQTLKEKFLPKKQADREKFLNDKMLEAVEKGLFNKIILLVSLSYPLVNARDEKGKTALMRALEKENRKIALYLIKKDADIHAQDQYKETALCYALEKGYADIATDLISQGADIDVCVSSKYKSEEKLPVKKRKIYE